jgi:hypothetical protein
LTIFGFLPGELEKRKDVAGSTLRWTVSPSEELVPLLAGQN